jgi:hypothetical protein
LAGKNASPDPLEMTLGWQNAPPDLLIGIFRPNH